MRSCRFSLAAMSIAMTVMVSPVWAGEPPPAQVVPEPSSMLVWGGIMALGGVAYWWNGRRNK